MLAATARQPQMRNGRVECPQDKLAWIAAQVQPARSKLVCRNPAKPPADRSPGGRTRAWRNADIFVHNERSFLRIALRCQGCARAPAMSGLARRWFAGTIAIEPAEHLASKS